MERKTEKILGYDVDLMTFENAISYVNDNLCNNKGMHIITINPEIIEQASKSFEYNKIVKSADLIIPDGVGIKIALKLKGINQEQIPGIDFATYILKNCQVIGKNVALIGATEEVVKRTENLLTAEYKELKIIYTHNGFFPKHKEDEIIKNLIGIEPDVVLVALGAPKQDFFIKKCIERHPNAVYIGVGGEKELLLTVTGGESYDETITLDDKYDNEKIIYIILETIGKCVDGDFEFAYN